jgi:asparagine synthase (glutamine-hydrolysing)
MCGINGFNWNDPRLIQTMNEAIKHRGPDDTGLYNDENISLGHVRLSIIDLSSRGHQPMVDVSDNYYLVYNGEIYNFQEIREELVKKGIQFKSKTDTEVLLYSYIIWGPECLQKFNGMFAFAIYDKNKGMLFLARDRVGIKPLYYYHKGGKFIFSSEIRGILSHDIEKKPNAKIIRDFLLFNISSHTNETFFCDINRLPKGHYITFNLKDNEIKQTCWWKFSFITETTDSYTQCVNTLKFLLKDSVRLRLISDVPVGTCLSGGIDSSSIACIIKDAGISDIVTFSATYPNFKLDETKYIDIVSKAASMKNYKIQPSAISLENDLFSLARSTSEPIGGPSGYAQYCVQKLAAANGVIVLLDGQGADELFGGYHYFFGFYLKNLLVRGKVYKFLRELFGLIKGGHFKIGVLSLMFLLVPISVREQFFIKKSLASAQLINDNSAETSFFQQYYQCSSLHEALEFHMNYKLEHLLNSEDSNSMAHSREARVPFLDYRIMEFVMHLPDHFIIREGMTKTILRDAVKDILPPEILQRRDKIGFATPESEWLRHAKFRHLLNIWFVENEPLCNDYIDLNKMKKYIQDHLSGKKDHGRELFQIIFLETWCKLYFPNKI